MSLNFIPQVFYDLIARLIPGSILIWSSYLIYFGPSICVEHFKKILNNTWDLNILLIFMTLLIAYIISIVLSGFWTLISDTFGLIKIPFFLPTDKNAWNRIDVDIIEDTQKAKQTIETIQNNEDVETPSPSFIYDYIRLKKPDIGARLVKIRAELHMCKVLILGWIILFFINLPKLISVTIKEFLIIECVIIFSIIGVIIFLRNLNKKFLVGLANFWILLHLEQHNANQNKDCEKQK